MGISRNAWMTGSRKTADNLTWRELMGQQIFQGIRAVGQSNPSPQFIQNQAVARAAWVLARPALAVIRLGITSKLTKQPAASAWYKDNRPAIIGTGVAPAIVPVPANYIWSKGTMTPTPLGLAASASAGARTVTVLFQTGIIDSTTLATDLPLLVLYNATKNLTAGFVGLAGTDDRSLDAGTWAVSTSLGFMSTGDSLYVYLGWYGAPTTLNAGTSSNSLEQHITVAA